MTDAERLDWLEFMARQRGGILLHSETESTGRLGLGLSMPERPLRSAIDQAMQFDRRSPGKSASLNNEGGSK